MDSGGKHYKLLLILEPAYDASFGSSNETVLHHPALILMDEIIPDLVGTVRPAVESVRVWENNPVMKRLT
jgi:hypothetical protein